MGAQEDCVTSRYANDCGLARRLDHTRAFGLPARSTADDMLTVLTRCERGAPFLGHCGTGASRSLPFTISPVRRPHGTVSSRMLSRITLVLGGISTLAVTFTLTTSCGDSGDCNPPKWTDQCVEASVLWREFPEKFRSAVGTVLEDADAGASGSALLRCPTLRELNYELVRPYSVELQGEAFTSEPESGRTDSLCCYTTTFYCY